jgi:hypothetical protein
MSTYGYRGRIYVLNLKNLSKSDWSKTKQKRGINQIKSNRSKEIGPDLAIKYAKSILHLLSCACIRFQFAFILVLVAARSDVVARSLTGHSWVRASPWLLLPMRPFRWRSVAWPRAQRAALGPCSSVVVCARPAATAMRGRLSTTPGSDGERA